MTAKKLKINKKRLNLEEFEKCANNPVYFIENYLMTMDTQKGYVPFKLFKIQKKALRSFHEESRNITVKYRQSGLSTLVAAYCVWLMAFADISRPEKILISGNKTEISINVLSKIVDFYNQLPKWMVDWDEEKNMPAYVTKNNKNIKLPNGCAVKAVSSSTDALRGFTPTLLIMDEAAFIENGDEFWTSASPTLATGGKAILISTPNGQDPFYYQTYKKALHGENNFSIIDIKWFQDPRYNVGLTWTKDGITITEEDDEKFLELFNSGWNPSSPWFVDMAMSFNNDPRKINQELCGAFLGSGNNVYDVELIQWYRDNCQGEPIRKEYNDLVWIWNEPVPKHIYLLTIDASTGNSDDYTGFEIVDYTAKEQVLELKGKLTSEMVAMLACNYASKYNQCLISVDTTGGYGDSIVKILQNNFKYTNLFYSKQLINPNYVPDELDIPGYKFQTLDRLRAIERLGTTLREKTIKFKSSRLFLETDDFIYKNNRPDHASGAHDDLIMATAMNVDIYYSLFDKLKANESKDRRLLDAFVSVNKKNNPNINGVGSNSVFKKGYISVKHNNSEHIKINKQLAGLFGLPKR